MSCYIVQLYVDNNNNNDIRFDLQVDCCYIRTAKRRRRVGSVIFSLKISFDVTYQGRYIVESPTIYQIALVIQKTYTEYAQSPGHTRLHDIVKVSTRKMCPELRANMLAYNNINIIVVGEIIPKLNHVCVNAPYGSRRRRRRRLVPPYYIIYLILIMLIYIYIYIPTTLGSPLIDGGGPRLPPPRR